MAGSSPIVETSEWERCTRNGFASLVQGCLDDAARHWFAARDATAPFAESDPRRAAALNNAGLALWMSGRSAEARLAFEDAQRVWAAARDAAAALQPPLTGRGSVFHIRLAARHGQAFANIHRETLKTLLRGAEALTSYNLRNTIAGTANDDADDASFTSLVRAAEDAFGVESAEVSTIRRRGRKPSAEAGSSAMASGRFMHERWRDDALCAPEDILTILAAAHLTAIAPSIRPREMARPALEVQSHHGDMTEKTTCQRHP